MSNLPVIAGVEIFVDSEGRYNLNALHKASGTPKFKAPNKWLETKTAKSLVSTLMAQTPNSGSGVLRVQNGGANPGTFAHELLAVSYAGWISPEFQLTVNQTFIDYRTGKLQPQQQIQDPALASLHVTLAAQMQILAELDAVKSKQAEIDQRQREAELNSLKRDRKLARDQARLDRKFQAIETAQDYFTMLGWWHLTFTMPLDNTKAAKYGRMASRYCREHGFEIGQISDPRFGLVNTYPREVLELLFLD
jgi:hypothetical protein